MRKILAMLLAITAILTACSQTPSNPPGTSVLGGPSVAPPATTTTTRPAVKSLKWSSPPAMTIDASKNYTATVDTSLGSFTIQLFAGETPKTVNNFVFLANQGYYEGILFHRVIQNFMIQTGDPTGTGSGGPGYKFQDEPVTRDYTKGTVAMANAGPNTNGSQFFIVQADMTGKLPKNYTIFGEVIKGLDVVDKIANTPVTANAFGEPSKPTQPVLIKSVDIAVH